MLEIVGVTVAVMVEVFPTMLVAVSVAVVVWVTVGIGLEVRQGTARVTVDGIELAPEFQLTNSKTSEFWQV